MVSKLKLNRNLPIEIESNILSRLPVKTLIRFASVHKSWYSLISNSYFVNKHRLQNRNNNLLALQNVENDILVVDSCSNEQLIFEKPYPYEFDVVDSCNGLVCVYGQSYTPANINGNQECDMACISLWNPALRTNKIIHHKRMSMKRHHINLCVGFGFNNQTNDYKVISFTNDSRTCTIKGVEIYSLSSDSWRDVNGAADSLDKYSYCVEFGVYISDAALIPSFHGAYFWLADARVEFHEEPRVISFDMKDEVFKELMLPPTVSQKNTYIHDLRLFNCKDSLGMVEMVENTMFYDSYFCYVWVMKEYSQPKSWTKLYKLEQCPFYELSLLGVTLETERALMTHDFGRNEVHELDVDKLKMKTRSAKDIGVLKRAWHTIPFSESLMLLDANN